MIHLEELNPLNVNHRSNALVHRRLQWTLNKNTSVELKFTIYGFGKTQKRART